MKSKKGTFLNNLAIAFTAQGISLLLSLLMSLVVPKMLGTTSFGYWQLFIFYSSYVGFFHFGLIDGIYLRYGGKSYTSLDFPLFSSQFWLFLLFQCFIALGVIGYACYGVNDTQRGFVIIAASLYMVVYNASLYIGYIFQTVNQTKVYSISVMIDRVSFIVFIIALLVFHVRWFQIFVLLYLLSKTICLFYCCLKGKEILFSGVKSDKRTIPEMMQNIGVGINLMISNIASMLIIGIGRYIIDGLWGIETFGKVSFSISLAGFFLLFISQVSMVLFPALKQTDKEKQRKIYIFGNDVLSILLAGVFVLYLPVKYLLGLWLPQYKESLGYLAILLPICAFDGKMQMLCSTYMKVLRKEKILLLFNVTSLVVSTGLCLFSGYILHSVQAILISMVAAITIRSILSNLYVSRIIGVTVVKNTIGEVILAVWFIFCTYSFTPIVAFALYCILYLFYLYFNRNRVKSLKAVAHDLITPSKA